MLSIIKLLAPTNYNAMTTFLYIISIINKYYCYNVSFLFYYIVQINAISINVNRKSKKYFTAIEDLSVGAIIHLTTHIKILGYAFGYVDRNINPMLEYHEIIELKQQRIIKLIKDLKEIYK